MELSQFYFELLRGFLNNKDLPFFIRQLAQRIARPVILTDSSQRILTAHDQSGLLMAGMDDHIIQDTKMIEFSDLIALQDLQLLRTSWKVGECWQECFQIPLVSQGWLGGYYYIIGRNELSKQDVKDLWEAALLILMKLKDLSNRREEREQSQTEFIRDIIYNNYDSHAAIIAKARFWGWDLEGSWALAVGEVDKEKEKLAKELIPVAVSNKRWSLTAIINERVIVLIPLPGNDKRSNKDFVDSYMKRLSESLKQQGLTKMKFGVGSFVDAIDYIYKVYQEAKIALELGHIFGLDFPCYFAEMGILKFVFTQPAYELQEFSQRVIGDLFVYDRENGTELIHTLVTYFDARLQIPECARLLFIHENTLRNRLRKIEQISGLDLHRIEHLTNLYVAWQIVKIGEQQFSF
ncbi:helix-turn-helix domain-containing protein [Desulfosporosinus sp. FKA]|uniref:PucR family transcriptional regulator n=1 Tax=Desulfosporosinus sp. FKA TaxID=1969834 RepID=UPI000B49F495|nr:helix-turn-helix domain-containing protein [Desulfosporosinus sp. FKA]